MSAPPRLRVAVLAALVAAACLAALLWAPHTPAGVRALADAAGPFAPWALLLAWVVLTPALFSGTVLAGATGLVLGPELGVPVALAGATAGATAAFGLARAASGTHDAPARLRALQARLERRPILGLAAVRAAPGVPATLLNYAAGMSRVRPRHFVAGITLGGAPRVIAYASLGGGLSHLTSPPVLAAAVAGAALSVGAGLVLARRVAQPAV